MVNLDNFGPFTHLSGPGKKALQQGTQVHLCHPSAPILHKGQTISGAYFVLSGRLRVYTLTPGGTEATLYFIDPGETCVFALNSLFNDLLYPAWVQAMSDTEVALIPGPTFRQLFASEPIVQDLTVRALSTLVFRLMEGLEEIHAFKLQQRLANLLLTQASSSGEIRMTQQQIADHLGTTREVVARLLRELAVEGCVETARGRIRILDAPQLGTLIGQN